MQNLCGISSLAFTTTANRKFLCFTACIHLFPSSLTFASPQQKPYNRSSFSQKRHRKHRLVEHSLTSHNPPPCVWLPVSAVTRPRRLRRLWSTHRLLAWSQLSCHARECGRESLEALIAVDGQLAQLPRPDNAAIACVTPDHWLYRPRGR